MSITTSPHTDKSLETQNVGDPQPWYEVDIIVTNIFDTLNGTEILTAQLVSKTWAGLLFNVQNDRVQFWKWKMLLKEKWPHFNVDSTENYTGKTLRQCYELRRVLEDKILPELWTVEFAQQFKYGKYSKWVCSYSTSKFILDVACIVQILSVFSPKAYLTLDGADKTEYSPEHSTCHGPWPGWSLHRNENIKTIEASNILKLDENAYAAMVICQSICTHRWYHNDQVGYENMFNNIVCDVCGLWNEKMKENRETFYSKYPINDRKKRHMSISAVGS